MLFYLYSLLIVIFILMAYKYHKKIRLNDVLLASIVVVIGCSLYKGRKVEGLCLNSDDSSDSQGVACETRDGEAREGCDSPSQCLYQEVDAGLTYAFRHANLGHDASTHPTQADWNTWLNSSAHCVSTDPTVQTDVSACTAVSELTDSTACLAVMKADGQTSACSYYTSGSTTATGRDTPTGTCTGNLTSDGNTDCSTIPAFVADSVQTNCPTDDGCTFTATEEHGGGGGGGGTDAPIFKLGYSDDSGFFESIYDCSTATLSDSDKIQCPVDTILDPAAKTEGKFGGSFFAWLTGEPSNTTAKGVCCVAPS
jgi:hypothetical protein